MQTMAVVMEAPGRLAFTKLDLADASAEDVVVDVEWSGISTGTERLLWSGRMPSFPGMGYPLVPGYESVGRVRHAGDRSGRRSGERVFVPGARCFGDVRGLFGGAAATVVVPGFRAVPVDDGLAEHGVLLALAATAHHAIVKGGHLVPDLIVGHGVLGRLLARLVMAIGAEPPVVWERDPARSTPDGGYVVRHPDDDQRRNYRALYDVSGDPGILDTLVQHMAPAGEIVMAGFYADRLSFAFPPAFMREAKFRVAAEWRPTDLQAVQQLLADGRLSLDGLVTHRREATAAAEAYAQAFDDPSCLKMVLDWRTAS